MVIAALIAFAILMVAWILAPERSIVRSGRIIAAESDEAEALAAAA